MFTTAKGIVISARKVVIEEEVWFEIILPAGKLENLPAEEEERILDIITRALGKEPRVKYIGMGESPFEHILLIVLEESENIEQLRFVDIQALVGKLLQTLLSLILTSPAIRDTESYWLQNPRSHHRFDKWEVSRGLHHQDVRSSFRN